MDNNKPDSVKKFLHDWMNGIESDLEIHSRIDKLTFGFDSTKLNLMLKDLECHIEEIELLCLADPIYSKTMKEQVAPNCPSKLELGKALCCHISTLVDANKVTIYSKENVEFNYEDEKRHILGLENRFHKALPIEVVFEHFEKLTTNHNKNKEPYLTKEQLISFIKKAFLADKTQLRQKINYAAGEKGKIIQHFYDMYVIANSEWSYPTSKSGFVNQFMDCFDNWQESTVKSFFKTSTKKKMI